MAHALKSLSYTKATRLEALPSFTKHVPTKHGSSKIIIRKQTKSNENKLKARKKHDLSLNKSNS